MVTFRIRLALIFSLLGGLLFPGAVEAAKGTPNSADFGYGVQLDLQGKNALESLPSATALHVDWISIDLDWAGHWKESQSQPDLHLLDQIMQYADETDLSILLSITNAPDWASTPQGPDPSMTAWFVSNLAKRYPALHAVELFPAANTQKGWGAAPDPRLYIDLLKITRSALQEAGSTVLVVAGGLSPLAPNHDNQDQDDLVYLQGLYQAGGAEQLPVISLQMSELTGDPLQSPDPSEHRILRHYEEVRQVMLANHHTSGVLWITHISGPSGKIQASDSAYRLPQEQTLWLIQAYRMLRAQLYIGVAFYDQLNPPANSEGDTYSLIRSDSSRNPFYEVFEKLIAQNNQGFDTTLDFGQPQQKHISKARG